MPGRVGRGGAAAASHGHPSTSPFNQQASSASPYPLAPAFAQEEFPVAYYGLRTQSEGGSYKYIEFPTVGERG